MKVSSETDIAGVLFRGAENRGLMESPSRPHHVANGSLMCVFCSVATQSPNQVRFVIGHEIGHHVAGHLNGLGHFLKLPAYLVPFLYPAYSRARELTCDRVGAALSGNIEAARSALQMLACGSAKLNAQLNPAAFQEQEQMVPSIAGWVLAIFSTYPRLTKRVAAVTHWHETLHSTGSRLKEPSFSPQSTAQPA